MMNDDGCVLIFKTNSSIIQTTANEDLTLLQHKHKSSQERSHPFGSKWVQR